ncbi:MAG TPA: cysteine dioxygenase family protein [Thermoanaerobaculia bacterium]|nr:cysteine dioxygenase family protein [Thermoanaerobaculia bacterium]
MTTTTIPGLDGLCTALDEAVREPDEERLTDAVKEALVRTVTSQALELPAELTRPRPDGYARRLLHLCPAGRYSVLAMTWGPGQATPLHDHDGRWCVEGVYSGEIEVTRYDLVEERDGRYRFRLEGAVRAGVGNAGTLIPPFDYHTIANTSGDAPAVTLHVYGGEMTRCTVFTAHDDGWYERQQRTLSYHD